jgi:hypothetical protein
MYTEMDLTKEGVLGSVDDQELRALVDALEEEDRWNTRAELLGKDWTARQVHAFIDQANAWTDGINEVRVAQGRYGLGLVIRQKKTYTEMLEVAINHEIYRRRDANRKEDERTQL